MEKYYYQEFVDLINNSLKGIPNAQVTVRTVKFWVEQGLLPEPRGSGRWRHFDYSDVIEAVSIRKLQFRYRQSIEDIKKLGLTARINPHVIHSDDMGNFHRVVSAIELFERSNGEAESCIEAFKHFELTLIYDDAYNPPFRFVKEEQLADSYIEVDGKIYRLLSSTTNSAGEQEYYQPEHIGMHISEHINWLNGIGAFLRPLPDDGEEKAEKIRVLIDHGVMTSPRYRHKADDYMSTKDIKAGENWLLMMNRYGLSLDTLKRLRARFESDINEYFYIPEGGLLVEAPIFYEFQRQVVLLNCCIDFFNNYLSQHEDTVIDHIRESSLKLIEDYLNGYFFLCEAFTPHGIADNVRMCIKTTPINKLSAQQLKLGLSQGKFNELEVKEVVMAKEAELTAIKAIVNNNRKK